MQRLRATRRDLDKPILLKIGARPLPERLPICTLDKTLLRTLLLKTGDRHVTEALEHRLHELARLVPEHRRHPVRIGCRRHENVVLRRGDERFARRVERQLVPLAHLEIDRDPTVKIIKAPNLPKPPCHVQHACTGLIGHQSLQAAERLRKRTNPKANRLHKRKKKAVLCRLLQNFPHAGGLNCGGKNILVVFDNLQDARKILRFGLDLKLDRQIFHLLICHGMSPPLLVKKKTKG